MRNNIFYYFKKSIAFFDIKAKTMPPVVFLIMLALFAANVFSSRLDYHTINPASPQFLDPDAAAVQSQASLSSLAASILIMLSINMVSFVYLDAVIRDAKQEEYSNRICIQSAIRSFPRLMGVTIFKNAVIIAGLFLLIVPGIYFAILFIFAECAALDKKCKIGESIKQSVALTSKKRGEIFKVVLFCNIAIFIFVILILIFFASNNAAVFQYILLFMLSMYTLIGHRLAALLYADALASQENREIAL